MSLPPQAGQSSTQWCVLSLLRSWLEPLLPQELAAMWIALCMWCVCACVVCACVWCVCACVVCACVWCVCACVWCVCACVWCVVCVCTCVVCACVWCVVCVCACVVCACVWCVFVPVLHSSCHILHRFSLQIVLFATNFFTEVLHIDSIQEYESGKSFAPVTPAQCKMHTHTLQCCTVECSLTMSTGCVALTDAPFVSQYAPPTSRLHLIVFLILAIAFKSKQVSQRQRQPTSLLLTLHFFMEATIHFKGTFKLTLSLSLSLSLSLLYARTLCAVPPAECGQVAQLGLHATGRECGLLSGLRSHSPQSSAHAVCYIGGLRCVCNPGREDRERREVRNCSLRFVYDAVPGQMCA